MKKLIILVFFSITVLRGFSQSTIYAPDFAFPDDVLSTARAFIDSHPASSDPGAAPERLLAAQEEALAQLDIDWMSVNAVLKQLLRLADLEPEPATRAMFLAYAAQICRTHGYQGSGFLTTPDPERVDDWGSRAISKAGDSLYVVAYDIAPVTTPLSRYAAALTQLDPRVNLIETVRDFILYYWTKDFNSPVVNKQRDKAVAALPEFSPMWFYVMARKSNSIKDKLKFLEDNIENPNVIYSIIEIMSENSSNTSEAFLQFCKKYNDSSAPGWFREVLDDYVLHFKKQSWGLRLPWETLTEGVAFNVILNSFNTDSLQFDVYRFDSDLGNAIRPDLSKGIRMQPWIFTPHTGVKSESDTLTITLPAGYYYVECSDNNRTSKVLGENIYSTRFCVLPWQIVRVCPAPETTMLQVLNPKDGNGVRGIDITATRYNYNPSEALNAQTDDNGCAWFSALVRDVFTLKDPKSGNEYKINAYVNYYSLDSDSQRNKDKLRISMTTDLPAYHPGDTVRWVAVARNDTKTVENHTSTLEVMLPKNRSLEKTSIGAIPPTDRFGRSQGEYVIPKDCDLGTAYLQTMVGSTSFRIADFKLPELTIKGTKFLFNNDSVTLTGYVYNRVNAPRGDTDVKLVLQCDTTVTMNGTTDNAGRFSFVFPRDIAVKEDTAGRDEGDVEDDDLDYDSSTRFTIEAITEDGYNTDYSSSYPNYADVRITIESKNFYDVSKGLTFNIKSERLGCENPDEPVKCRWELLRETHTIAHPYEVVLKGEAMTGDVILPPSMVDTLSAGSYKIEVEPVNLHGEGDQSWTDIYNTSKTELPEQDVAFWIPTSYDTKYDLSGDNTIKVTVGTAFDNTYLWYIPQSQTKEIGTPRKLKLKKGYNTVTLQSANTDRLFVWGAHQGHSHYWSLDINEKADPDTLSLNIESFRDQAYGGGVEKWSLVTRRQGIPVRAAVSVDVFDSRLSAYGSPLRLWLDPVRPFPFYGRLKIGTSILRTEDISFSRGVFSFDPELLRALYPSWLYDNYGPVAIRGVNKFTVTGYGTKRETATADYIDDMVGEVRGLAVNESQIYGARAPIEMAMVKQEADSDTDLYEVVKSENTNGSEIDNVTVRIGERLNALWKPMLVTDSVTGRVDIDFLLPNQSTTWILKAVAWTTDLKSATLQRTFTATKPIYVKPNLPRFVRVGDRVDIVTSLTNSTDTLLRVGYDVAFGEDTIRGCIDLGPQSTKYVTVPITVTGELALSDSLSFTFRASSGQYGDGERVMIPILPSSALVIESIPFYMKPNDSTLCLDIPQLSANQGDTRLHFTANPMWTVVEALPAVLDEYESLYPTSTCYAQSWYVARTAMRIVENHSPSAQVIDTAKARMLRKKALEGLTNMQHADGGFGWGTWSTTSSLWNSLDVLSWFDRDSDEGDISEILSRLLDYVDNNVIANGEKPGVNIRYTYIRGAFGKPSTLAGQAVMDATINHVLKNWKSLSLNDKCLAATLLARNGYESTAALVLKSVRQHGVITADRGLVFPNLPGLNAYTNMLVAFHAVEPHDPTIDAVRQALICMRRGASWGNTSHTAYAVRAMVMTGTDWTIPAEMPVVTVDNHQITLSETDRLRGAFDASLSGKKVCIHRESFLPAYGAIVTERIAPLTDMEPFDTQSLSLSKAILVRDAEGNLVQVADSLLRRGQKVSVLLRIFTDTEMTDITVTDDRSATFEPVIQTGRYMRSENGTWYYLQNANKATNVFIDRLKRGYTEIIYEVIINNAGTFTTGVSTLTNGVDPDLTVHSGSEVLIIKED